LKLDEQVTRPRTRGGFTVTDVTDDVNAAVRSSGIRDGIACVYSPDTTCCVRVNEFETGLLEDFAALLRRLLPRETADVGLTHGDLHGVSMLLGSAGESIPVSRGELLLGRWQRVLFVELDRERDGHWLVEVIGSRW
jgi:secondary thiamine-phosphate synthase enzyme